jgi:Fe-S oxidoreductase
VAFSILGKDELCCGDPARRLGEESLFQEFAHRNIRRFKEYGCGKILTLCPHCYNTLKNEYPALGGTYEVHHASEFVSNLIEQERITLKYPCDRSLAIHDPCYLGRGNGVYQPLRDVCRMIPRIELKELARNRENAFCCGGGGGRMWLHENLGRHINQIRAEEISESDLDMIATACPYCLTMLDDGIKSLERERPPKIVDLMEVVASSVR